MKTLKQRLDRIRAGFAKQVPAETAAVMHRATDDLRASGILSRIPAPGVELPAFELPDSEGSLSSGEDSQTREIR